MEEAEKSAGRVLERDSFRVRREIRRTETSPAIERVPCCPTAPLPSCPRGTNGEGLGDLQANNAHKDWDVREGREQALCPEKGGQHLWPGDF